MEESIIEIDATDENYIEFLFESGIFGEIYTDAQKIEVLVDIFTRYGWSDLHAEILMCANHFLPQIKKESEFDGEIMAKLVKMVSREIKSRWL